MNDLEAVAEKLRDLRDLFGDPMLKVPKPATLADVLKAIDNLEGELKAAQENAYGEDL
jgi:hypothetical protein